jgi:hypothetical protein
LITAQEVTGLNPVKVTKKTLNPLLNKVLAFFALYNLASFFAPYRTNLFLFFNGFKPIGVVEKR